MSDMELAAEAVKQADWMEENSCALPPDAAEEWAALLRGLAAVVRRQQWQPTDVAPEVKS